MTWEEFNKKHPYGDSNYTEEQERSYINDLYDVYETDGFASFFDSPYESEQKYNGMRFKIIKRIGLDDPNFDLEVLPMWSIQFDNGDCIDAFPEEIRKENGK